MFLPTQGWTGLNPHLDMEDGFDPRVRWHSGSMFCPPKEVQGSITSRVGQHLKKSLIQGHTVDQTEGNTQSQLNYH